MLSLRDQNFLPELETLTGYRSLEGERGSFSLRIDIFGGWNLNDRAARDLGAFSAPRDCTQIGEESPLLKFPDPAMDTAVRRKALYRRSGDWMVQDPTGNRSVDRGTCVNGEF